MAEHLAQHPRIRATINLVPSLIEQIEDHIAGDRDELFEVCRKNTEYITAHDKEYLRRFCFQTNRERMIGRSARYTELANQTEPFTIGDYRDLIVHHTLAWLGEFERRKEYAATLIAKDRDYTEAEKNSLFDESHKLFLHSLSLHKQLKDNDQIELSTSPFYHPILPLLIDQRSAAEAIPNIFLPSKIYSMNDYASQHISRALSFMQERFGEVNGMWSSEGSISESSLRMLAENGVQWTASDEGVLMQSLPTAVRGDLEKYFPRKYITNTNEIVIFFRDHYLSDKIGFEYQKWYHRDAAEDFVSSIHAVRSRIIDTFGEDALDEACISVILDGENCWEYYEANGYDFLQSLYTALENSDEIETVTFSDAISQIGSERIQTIEHIKAGSWINANFAIWIGHPEKNHAWDLLCDAAEFVDTHKRTISPNILDEVETELMRAQGSDWFWWYGDDHHSPQKDLFDVLFRTHLANIYSLLGAVIPASLKKAIISQDSSHTEYSAMHRGSDTSLPH
jgi:alpha-amylase/alpha-mannosidase (GH57 family)